jgi:hypothetical protein
MTLSANNFTGTQRHDKAMVLAKAKCCLQNEQLRRVKSISLCLAVAFLSIGNSGRKECNGICNEKFEATPAAS